MPSAALPHRSFVGFAVAGIVAILVAAGPVRAQMSDIEREWRTLQKAQSAHARGRDAAQRGDKTNADVELAAAAELYRQLIEQNPLRRDLYAPLADTLIRRGNSAAAYALLIGQTRGGNKEPAVQRELVRALQGMRRYRHALEEAQKLAQSEPKNQVLQAMIGEVAAEAGESALAIQVLGPVLAQPPTKKQLEEAGLDLTALRLLRAKLLLGAKRGLEAMSALAELANAEHPEALLLLGEAYTGSGRLDDAVKVLRRCLVVSTSALQRSRATVLLAQALQRGGNNKEAINVLRQAGEAPEVLLALSQIYMAEQPPNPAAALMVVERAAQTDVKDQRVCIEHASLLELMKRKEEAMTELVRCIALSPSPHADDAAEALAVRADVELRLGRYDDAITNLRAVLTRMQGAADPQPVKSRRLTTRLAQALLRRGIEAISTAPKENQGLADLEEAHKLMPSSATAQGLGLGYLSLGRAKDAATLLLPLCQTVTGTTTNDARLLGACGRALRESDQPEQALPLLQRAETILALSPSPPLRAALRQEQAGALVALSRPMDAIKLIEGNDAAALRSKAQAFLAAVRAFYNTPTQRPTQAPQVVPPPPGVKGKRGPFPALRTAQDQPILAKGPGGKPLRGPFPPLRGATGQVEPTAAPAPVSQGLTEERQVLTFAQAALRGGTLSVSERGEAMLYQVVALYHGGQYTLALKLLGEVAAQVDAATLDALLGPGGFADLKARVTLRGGDFYQAMGLATQALPLLKREAAISLKNTLAVAYTDKALEMIERGQPDRAYTLLRSAWTQARGGPAENDARANYNLAVMLLNRGKLEEAKFALLRIDVQLVPEVWIGLGSYHDLLGDGKGALENYRRYLQAAVPGDPQLVRVQQWVDVLERVHEVTP